MTGCRTSTVHEDQDAAREACGLFGVFNVPRAADVIYEGLFAQQHRGQEGVGIVVSDGTKIRSAKRLGLVCELDLGEFDGENPAHIGIGHVRYSTTGSARINNVQPLVAECVDGIWAVAHNGNLTNAAELRDMYRRSGAIFQTSTDSETLIHLLADPMFRERPGRVERALGQLRGAFSFLLMTRDRVMAARDPAGLRPLCMGTLGGGVVFASESCALKQVGAAFVRDVEPGELLIVDAEGTHSHVFAERFENLAQCIFELVYFARPDSTLFGGNVHAIRLRYGMRLAEEHPVPADIVVAIPDSGSSAALGYSRRSGIPLDFGFIRNHYVGRTFIMPGGRQREHGVDLKLSVLPEVVRDRRVVVIDDSIVRGTTVRRRVVALRRAGASEVHVRISCPPVVHPCYYGIDFATKEELIAANHGAEQIRDFLEADSLGYLSIEGLLSPFENKRDFCTACFDGSHRMDLSRVQGKLDWEADMFTERSQP